MVEKNELKNLFSIAKKILNKKRIEKIKKLKSLDEKKNLLEHSIKKELELKVTDFRHKVRNLVKKEKEVFFIRVKINLLKLKINYFIINFNKKDFRKIMKLIKKIEGDLESV